MSGAMLWYLLTISVYLILAAWAAEWLLIRLRQPARWAWAVALLLCFTLPFMPAPTPALTARAESEGAMPLSTGAAPAIVSWPVEYLPELAVPSAFLRMTSLTAAVLLLAGWATLRWRSRRWEERSLLETPVLVAPATGPAVIGFVRPRIVVPEWAFALPPSQQRMLLAHEQSHIAARDPLLLLSAALVVVAMPWNPLLWFGLSRLRGAIEIDCDRRVLHGGAAIDSYARCLIDSVSLASAGPAPAVGSLSLSTSHLERRVRLMLHPYRARKFISLLVALLAVGLVTSAVRATPPVAAQPTGHKAIEMERLRLREANAKGLFYQKLTAGKLAPGAMYNVFHDNWRIRDPKEKGC